jgi:hypothetical protein
MITRKEFKELHRISDSIEIGTFEHLCYNCNPICTKSRSETGGVFPITIDSKTSEGFCLLGLANIKRREYDDEDYFYTLPDNSIGGVRNELCHFHGWVDCFESLSQAKAREGYEESRGVFGSMLDIWRCLSLEGFSYEMPQLSPMSLINLGNTSAAERASIIARFLRCPVHCVAMAETRGVRFVPLKQLYDVLRYTFHFQIPTSLSMIDPTEFPHDSIWLRSFLDEWLTNEIEEQEEGEDNIKDNQLLDLPSQEEGGDTSTLPTQIYSPWHDQVITLVCNEERNLERRCNVCQKNIITSAQHGGAPFYYLCEKSRYFEDSGQTWYHARCIFQYDSKIIEWKLKDERLLCNKRYRFEFFEDPMIQKIMSGARDGDLSLRPISELPPLGSDEAESLDAMLRLSVDLQRDYPRGRPDTRSETQRLMACATCGDMVYVQKEARHRHCRACKNLYDKLHEVAAEGGRGGGRCGGRGGRGRGLAGDGRGGRGRGLAGDGRGGGSAHGKERGRG